MQFLQHTGVIFFSLHQLNQFVSQGICPFQLSDQIHRQEDVHNIPVLCLQYLYICSCLLFDP